LAKTDFMMPLRLRFTFPQTALQITKNGAVPQSGNFHRQENSLCLYRWNAPSRRVSSFGGQVNKRAGTARSTRIFAVITPPIAALLLLEYQKHFRSTSGRRKICGEYGFSPSYSPEKASFMSYKTPFYSPSSAVLNSTLISSVGAVGGRAFSSAVSDRGYSF